MAMSATTTREGGPIMKIAILFLAAICGAAIVAPAQACIPDIWSITDYTWDPPAPISFCLAPDRDALAFTSAGSQVEAQLRFHVTIWSDWPDTTTTPVEWWIEPPITLCSEEMQIVPRDEDGIVTVVPLLRGGGHRDPGETSSVQLWIPVCPNQLLTLGPEISFNSPDINGDLVINLTDLATFSTDFYGSYRYRSDFVWDGQINLADLSILAQSYQATCE